MGRPAAAARETIIGWSGFLAFRQKLLEKFCKIPGYALAEHNVSRLTESRPTKKVSLPSERICEGWTHPTRKRRWPRP